jgi:hypothetical protein
MTRADRSWWEQARSHGPVWFILRHSVIPFALRFSVVFFLIGVITLLLQDPTLPVKASSIVCWAVISWACVSLAIGTLAGVALWKRHGRDYNKSEDQQDV